MGKFLIFQISFFLVFSAFFKTGFSTGFDTIVPRHKVTLPEAHIGNTEVDIKLLDSYEQVPENIRLFYLEARTVFAETASAGFTHPQVIEAARKNDVLLMGGPMLGRLENNGLVVWLRPATDAPLYIKVIKPDGSQEKLFTRNQVQPGEVQRIELSGLTEGTNYQYFVFAGEQQLAKGSFTTAPDFEKASSFRLAFGSCFHKIGVHNSNLVNSMLKSKPHALMLLGDIAVDDRENRVNMHRADYLLRDVSNAWKKLSSNIPVYTCWDDHDYFNNDLSGVPEGFTSADREKAREVWQENWNNPVNEKPGIYFNTRIGPVELIMLDTRSLRDNQRRGEYGSYLGTEQLTWLKQTLKNSEAPFKIISSGTMWSDFVSNGKDSWGTWDTHTREELFNFVETEKIAGVLLVSGDRHGARGFTIPRPSGYKFYEFEAASLGGVPGPDAMANDSANQLFGYHGSDIVAFGEFTFNTLENTPSVMFRLIDENGSVLEKYIFSYMQLMPKND